MHNLILSIVAVEKAMRAKRHGYHGLWSSAKLLKCAQMAGRLGFLTWE